MKPPTPFEKRKAKREAMLKELIGMSRKERRRRGVRKHTREQLKSILREVQAEVETDDNTIAV